MTKPASLAARKAQAIARQRAERFLLLCTAHRVPRPEREHRFHPTRKWAFDFAWPALKIALESEGGSWSGGRHTRGKGFAQDCEKYTEAALDGWCVLRVLSAQLCTDATIALVRRAIAHQQREAA